MNIKRVLDSLNLDQIRTDLADHYHTDGPGRTPITPLSMLKAQLAKHLLNIISDRRLALRLRSDHRVARARGTIIGKVIAVNSTHLKAFSSRAMDNRNGRSDPDARVGRGRRGFILGYRVHTACCADSELPIAFTVAPCNEYDKVHFEPLLERVHRLGVRFKEVLADAQYSSVNVREVAEWFDAEPVIPVRRDSRVEAVLRVGHDFVARGLSGSWGCFGSGGASRGCLGGLRSGFCWMVSGFGVWLRYRFTSR